MKQLSLLSLLFVLFLTSACVDDDGGNPIAFIGRADGWVIDNVDTDFGTKATAAINALTDEEIADDPRTRDAIVADYETRARTASQVDDCDRDDILFFVQNGVMRIILGNVPCAEDGDASPLAVFNDKIYSSNTDASEITIREPNGQFIDRFTVLELTEDRFTIETQRTVPDSLLSDLNYMIQYNMIAN